MDNPSGWALGWDMVSAIATVIGALGIFLAYRQLRFEAWIKAQEIFTEDKFTEARRKVLQRLDCGDKPWSNEDVDAAALVCRRMDELCRLVPYLGKRRCLIAWDVPIAKAWVVLAESFIPNERRQCGWPTKWEAFEDIAQSARARLANRGYEAKRKG